MAEDNQASGTFVKKLIETSDHDHEKAWWQSKKFFAFLMAELGFFVLMGITIYEQDMDKLSENLAFMVLAITAGFLAIGYILGQAALDRYVRVAALTMGHDPSKLDPKEDPDLPKKESE